MKNIYDLDNKQISARIGQIIKNARIAAKMTQTDLCEKSGISVMTVSGFESGRSSVSFLTLIQLLRSLNMLEMLDIPNLQAATNAKQRVRTPAEHDPATLDPYPALTYAQTAQNFINNTQNITIEAIIKLKAAEAEISISAKLRPIQSQADKEIAFWMNKNIDIQPYVTASGYKKKHSTERWRRFEKDDNFFLITDANTLWNVKTHKNVNLFDFIIENFPKTDPAISNTKHMIDTVLANEGLTLFSKRTRPSAPIAAHPIQTKPAQKGFSISDYRIQPLKPSQNYLINRGITPQTLTSPLFAGAIMEGNKADNYINNIIYPFKTHPAHTTEQMVTLMQQFNKKLEIDGKLTDKFFAKGEGKNKSLWFSNLLPSIRFIYIFENPLDAFSHFQLRNPENALYCATGGNPAKQQIALIIDLCAELKASPVLCFDRDLAGCRFDTMFLASVVPDKISITTSSEFSYNVQVSTSDLATLKSFLFVKKIKIVEKQSDSLTACIDTVDKAADFNRFINNLYLKTNANFEKSTEKDFNDDLIRTKSAV